MASTADDAEAKDSAEDPPVPDAAAAGSRNGSAVDKQEAPCIGLCVTHTPASTLYLCFWIRLHCSDRDRSFIYNKPIVML